jgi:HlyD family secretion protein
MKKKYITISIVVIIIAVAAYFIFGKNSDSEIKYTYGKVTTGNLDNTISATGTLQADTTVEVGTQVSGIIAKLFVDYNSNVKKGQLLALLDTTVLSTAVSNASVALQKAQAEYDQAEATYQRDKALYEKHFLSQLDYITAQTNIEAAQADVNSAKSALKIAKTNLAYAYIKAPISGKIIDRNIEQGQTVAASFSTPTLFTIADNMSNMQILASVDESDIGQVKDNQKVDFTVEAYPEKKFYGYVQQIRLDPQTVQNVVDYTVVINADNKGGLLLPGMTATIDFYIQQLNNVLLVPNAALKFQPDQEMLAQYEQEMKNEINNMPDSVKSKYMKFMNRNSSSGNRSFGNGSGKSQNRSQNFGKVWYFDSQGKLRMARLVLGFSDGVNTQVVRSRDLKDGMEVITGSTSGDNAQASSNNNFPRGMRRVF